MYLIFLIVVISLVYLLWYRKKMEHITGAVFTQLYSKGPVDDYLTFGTEKYIPEYWWGYYPGIWNYPSRVIGSYSPKFSYFPYVSW